MKKTKRKNEIILNGKALSWYKPEVQYYKQDGFTKTIKSYFA